jgi:hypothetical protein
MKLNFRSVVILCLAVIVLLLTSNRLPADTGICGGATTMVPFTDVAGNVFFCQRREGISDRPAIDWR